MQWTVTFSEAVNGVDGADFALVPTGLGGTPAISTRDPVGAAPATQWTVSASTGTGDGALGLNLNDNDTITDGASNKLGGTGSGTAGGGGAGNGSFTGQVSTIDHTAPAVSSINRAGQVQRTPPRCNGP